MTGTDQEHIACSVGDQIGAPEQERTQQDLTELGVRLHDVPEVLSANFQQLSGNNCPGPDQTAASRKHVQLSGKLASFVERDESLALLPRAHDLHAPL